MQNRLLLLLILSFMVHAEDMLVVPQSLIDQVDQGNSEVAYYIATQFNQKMFAKPKLIESYKKEAEKWMKMAAEMDYPQAMIEWGLMLESDDKLAQALVWYQKASELGIPDANERIGFFYIMGLGGLSPDCKTAYEWYEKAELVEYKLAYNDHAWNLATSSDKECRSPERALRLITKLIALYKQEFSYVPSHVLDTQAAVYASVSDFNNAIKIQKQAIEGLGEKHKDLASYQQRLDTYMDRKIWLQNKESKVYEIILKPNKKFM